jgi:hypothetical protein
VEKGAFALSPTLMLSQGDQAERTMLPKGKHAHQRSLRGLQTSGVTDMGHNLLQSPIKPAEPVVLHSRIVSPLGSSATPLSFHLPLHGDVHWDSLQSADSGCVRVCMLVVFVCSQRLCVSPPLLVTRWALHVQLSLVVYFNVQEHCVSGSGVHAVKGVQRVGFVARQSRGRGPRGGCGCRLGSCRHSSS